MKLSRLMLLSAIFSVGLLMPVASAASYSVEIKAPWEGAELEAGGTYTIEYTTDAPYVALYYATGEDIDKWAGIDYCIKAGGTYEWSVPDMETSAWLKIEGLDSCGGLVIAGPEYSGFFDIVKPGGKPDTGDGGDDGDSGDGLPGPLMPSTPNCECSSCTTCTSKLSGSCPVVYLTRDLSSSPSQCIRITDDNKVFDCQAHTISGGVGGREQYYGVYSEASGTTIRNCNIRDFEVGVMLNGASMTSIEYNTITNNFGSGVFATRTQNLMLTQNTIDTSGYGIFLGDTGTTSLQNNMICHSSRADIYSDPAKRETGTARSGDTCDTIYNWNGDRDVTWCDRTCNAGSSTTVGTAGDLQNALTGAYGTVTLTGNIAAPTGINLGSSHVTLDCARYEITGSGTGTGVTISNRVNVELRNCKIKNFATGVAMQGVSHSRILQNEMKNNNIGLLLRGAALPSLSSDITNNDIGENRLYGVSIGPGSSQNVFDANFMGGGNYSLFVDPAGGCDNKVGVGNSKRVGTGLGTIGFFSGTDTPPASAQFSELILCGATGTFSSPQIDNGADRNNGILVISSRGARINDASVRNSLNGIALINSSGVVVTNARLANNSKDCVLVDRSESTMLNGITATGCGRGVHSSNSKDTTVRSSDVRNNRLDEIRFYMTQGGRVEQSRLGRSVTNRTPTAGAGVLLEESSGVTLVNNSVTGEFIGVRIERGNNNRLERNGVCRNVQDIINYGTGSTGLKNNCSSYYSWNDQNVTGCAFCCSPPGNDINKDGVDDACDCYDAFQGPNEAGVDCGGPCPACIDCTWCNSRIQPLRLRGGPNSGFIDVVFAPRDDWSNWTEFEDSAIKAVRTKFLRLQNISTRRIYPESADKFNFYLYTGGTGEAESADLCFIPQGQGTFICASCTGWLPGEHTYMAWAWSCGLVCGLTLGLGCGCLAMEPDHFWDYASFADVGALLSKGSDAGGCAAPIGPPSQFIADHCDYNVSESNVIMHEFGHSGFALTDEYCGDTSYNKADHVQNVWGSSSDCSSAATSEGWTDGSCTQIRDVNSAGVETCSKNEYRYDSEVGTYDMMKTTCFNNADLDSRFKEADVRRINYVFENWPSGGSMGVLNYVQFSEGKMTPIMSEVVPNHPDLWTWVSEFTATTQSAGGQTIDTFSFADPRKAATDMGTVFQENTFFHTIVPLHQNVRWLRIFNGSSGEEMVAIDMGPAIWNYCSGVGWKEEYCATVDLDNDGVPDGQEQWGVDEAVDALNTSAPAAAAPKRDRTAEADAHGPMPTTTGQQGPAGGGGPGAPAGPSGAGGGMDLALVIVALVAVIAAIFGVVLLKRKNPAKEKPANETKTGKGEAAKKEKLKKCPKCGANEEPGNAFCADCETKL